MAIQIVVDHDAPDRGPMGHAVGAVRCQPVVLRRLEPPGDFRACGLVGGHGQHHATPGPLYCGWVRLYLVQHGQAKSEDEDPERPLTEQGADDVAGVARHAVGPLHVQPARLVHSGKLRARQTAEIWAGLLDVAVEPADGLNPNDHTATWIERLEAETDDLLIVGHLPHLGRLTSLLLTGDADCGIISFRPGGLVGLERTESSWMATLILPPAGT